MEYTPLCHFLLKKSPHFLDQRDVQGEKSSWNHRYDLYED